MNINTVKILGWLDEAARWSLYALMAAIPFSNALVSIFSVLTIAFFLFHWMLKKKFGGLFSETGGRGFLLLWPVLKWLIVAYVVWNLVSVVASIEAAQSLRAFFTKMLKNVVLLSAIIAHVRRKEHVLALLGALLAGACVACVDGLIQWQTGTDLFRGVKLSVEHSGDRVSGPFNHPNDLGGFLLEAGILLIAFLQAKFSFIQFLAGRFRSQPSFLVKARYPWILMGVFFLVMACLGLTFSRSAWFGFFAGAVFFGCANHRIKLWFVMAFMISALIFVPLFQQKRNKGKLINLPQKEFSFRNAVSFDYWKEVFELSSSGRAQFWKDAWRIASDHPLTGSGLNTYSDVLKTYPGSTKGWYAHNCYLQMAAEIGFVGVSLFILIFGSFYAYMFRFIARFQDPKWRTLCIGISAALFGFLLHCMFDTALYSVQLGPVAWILMAVAIAVVRTETCS